MTAALSQPFSLRLDRDSSWLVLLAELLLAGLIGWGLLNLGADGSSWILGGMAAGAIAFYCYRSQFNPLAQPNRSARKLGQLLVGLTVGFSIQHSNLAALSSQIPVFIVLTLGLLVGGAAIGWLYSRLEKTDALTAILATTPGNIGVMASIAADYGKSAQLVSLVQLMRFTAITSLIPLFSDRAPSSAPQPSILALLDSGAATSPENWLWLGAVLLLAGFASRLGERLKLPVAALLCPLIVGAVFNSCINQIPCLPPVEFTLPTIATLIGQILLGITIGEYWGMKPTVGRLAIARATVPMLLTFLMGLATAAVARAITSWDWLTCLLVTAPGGSPEMIWIALNLGHDVEVVTAGHLVRLVAINLSLPLLVAIASRLDLSRIGTVE